MVGGTGLEPVPWVSYLVINCHIVSYLYGYDGHTVSYLVINIHIVSHAFCGQIVGRTGNFVGSLLAGVDDGRSAVHHRSLIVPIPKIAIHSINI